MNFSLLLFFEFFKIGLFAIGGGLATLPFLQDFAQRTGLISLTDLANMVAISESTPGPIGINCATYFGFQLNGIGGSILCVLGLVTPSLLIIMAISRIWQKFQKNPHLHRALHGLRPASAGLISAAGLGLSKIVFLSLSSFSASGLWRDLFCFKKIALAVFLWILVEKTNRHPLVYLCLSAVVGIFLHLSV